MGITFKKQPAENPMTAKPAASSAASAPAGGKVPWFKKGSAAVEEVQKEDAQQQANWEAAQKLWRFWLKDGGEGRITFVDGNLDAQGVLDVPVFREHHLKINGEWGNHYICTGDTEPCPLCEQGDKPSLVAAMTVIDHRKFTTKDGKEHEWSVKLFVAKRDTLKYLQTLAGKREGLAGCTYDVMRTGEQSPRVGSHFEYVQKDALVDLQSYFTKTDDKGNVSTAFVPVDYEKELGYKTAAELRQLGFGQKTVIGSEKPLSESSAGTPGKKLDFSGKV